MRQPLTVALPVSGSSRMRSQACRPLGPTSSSEKPNRTTATAAYHARARQRRLARKISGKTKKSCGLNRPRAAQAPAAGSWPRASARRFAGQLFGGLTAYDARVAGQVAQALGNADAHAVR